jgi:hypothetical protein
MKLKERLTVSTMDFWYDLNEGYIKPEEICANPEDAKKVWEAIKLIKEFEIACEEQIEGFVQ